MAVGNEAGAEFEENHRRARAEDAKEMEEAMETGSVAAVETGDEPGDGPVKEIIKEDKGVAESDLNPKNSKAPKAPMVSFVRLFSFATPYDYVLMAIGTLGAGIHGAALPVLFLFFGKLLNGLGGAQDNVSHSVNKYALYFVYLAIVSLVTAWTEVAFWMHTGERQASKMREKYLEALLRQDVTFFDTEANTGDFVNTIASDPVMVQDAIGEKVGNFIHYTCTFIAGIIVGFTLCWRLAILTLAVVPLIASAGAFYMATLTGATARAANAYSQAGILIEQAASQVRTVHSFVGENKFVRAYDDALQSTAKFGARGGLAKGVGMGCTFGTLFFCWAFLLWYGGVLVRKGTTSGGETMATIFATIVGSMSLGQAMPNLSAFARGQAAAYKIFQVIERQPTINKLDENAQKLNSVDGLIELRDVDFSYPTRPDVFIFKNFSLTIPPGKTIAIVGNSGSGKSTIISLIERFYDPNAGEVLLDGHNLRTLDLKWLRGQIGLVNQEPVLFATSIVTNMLYGKENATKEEIEKTAKAANALSFIQQLPLGYQTQVGEKGVQLSGGQKQRVAIARAMLKDPKILLLDEATSALDTGSEQVVQEALDRLMMGRTTVVVAHRLSTVRDADAIAVVQDGRIVEMGTHDDLISRENGAYSALVRLQEQAATVEGAASARSGLKSGRRSVDRVSPHDSFRSDRRRSSVDSLPRGEEIISNKEVGDGTESEGSLKRLFAISRPDWRYVLAGTLGSMLAGCINPSYAFILASVLTAYFSNGSHMKHEISKYALILVGIGIIAPFIYILQHYSLAIAGERLVQRVRVKMLKQILRNEMGWFDEDENNSAQIAARLASDATNVRAAIGDRISMIMQNLTLVVIAYTVGFILQWKMTFVMMTVFPVLAVCSFADKALLKGFAGDQAKAHAQATRVASESVANIRTVAAFNAEKKVQDLFIEQLQGPARKSFIRGHVAGLGYGISQCFLYCSYGLGLWYAGKLVSSSDGTFGDVFKVFMLLVVTAVAASETLALSPDLVKGGQAVKSVFKVLDRKTEIEPDDPKGRKVDKIKGDIELKNVQFEYPSRPDIVIFKNLNLIVSAGRSLALVGASGSGKSSVIALIERFYDPTSGEVLIDGKDIRTYNLKSIRQHIALVQQEPALFNTSIYENIVYGKDGASEAEVIEAAKAANAHNFISALPDGYKTQVGDRGIQISGGQKQRVAIARAVLKDPAILLLDEATSALDAGSEKIVQDALDKLMKGRSTIIVAHRLSTIRGADSIAVVQDGNILEKGSHSQLLAQGGGYSRLINLQNRHQSNSASAD